MLPLPISLVWLALPLTSPPEDDDLTGDIADLTARIEALEAQDYAGGVDLSEDEAGPVTFADHVLANAWFQNLDLFGYAAFSLLDTGSKAVGVRPDASFLVRQATLFVDAQVWEDTSVFVEFQLVRFGHDYDDTARTGEVYGRFHDLFPDEEGNGVDVKVGRVDVPFGVEYLWQDAPDNPLVSQTAAFPYGLDEGVVVSREAEGKLSWLAAVLDGTYTRSFDDHPGKTLATRFWGDVTDDLHVTFSALSTGDTGKSSLLLGKAGFAPVGTYLPSTNGTSSSATVDALAYELDARWQASEALQVAAGLGMADVDDPTDPQFDRELTWWFLEPRYQLCEDVYAILRYSAVGTGDANEGYLLDGKPIAKGRVFGYDVEELSRLSVGVGWQWNPRTLLKLEVGQDHFDLINGSPFDPQNSDRSFVAIEAVFSF